MAQARDEYIEARTQAIGREIYERTRSDWGALFRGQSWTSRLLDWSIRHEQTRLKLFRFVDVLPTLSTDAQIARHFREYFGESSHELMGLFRAGTVLSRMGALGERAFAHTLKQIVAHLARTFIAASTPQEAIKTVSALRAQKESFTFDLLGESTLSDREADQYQNNCLDLLTHLTREAASWEPVDQIDQAPWGALPKVNLSVKLSALHPRFDPINPEKSAARVLERLLPLAHFAKAHGAHLHVDVEEQQIKELTHGAFMQMAEAPPLFDYRHLGVVVQAYLRESPGDVERLIEWAKRRGTPITIRLVKGAYWDFETARAALLGWPVPVFTEKEATDANFEALTRRLVDASDVIDLAIGSHNIRSIAHALAAAEAAGLPPRSIEFQFLYGMAAPLQRALVQRGERVRVYLPYGALIPGMAYLVRRLLENTSQHSFLRQGFAEGVTLQKLLERPVPAQPRPGVASGAERTDEAFRNQPHLDFAQKATRTQFHAALQGVRESLGLRVPLLIGGRVVETGRWERSVNPSDAQEVIGVCAQAGADEARLAVELAEKASPTWRRLPQEERSRIMQRAADLLEARRMELAAWIVLEAGKPWREADADVAEAIDFLRYYAHEALTLMTPLRLGNFQGEINTYQREARGIAAIISPWNFPLAILTGMTAAALVTGNAVVLKPAQPTPVIAYHLVRTLREAGVPPDVVHFLPGPGRSVGQALVDDPRVHLIAFTGSKEVGLSILESASRLAPGQTHVKRVIAEMGGKNAVIVDADADLDEAVAGVALSAFGYAGQKCSACSRVVILDEIYDAFTERLVEAVRSLPWGAAERPETVIGPVITAEARDRIGRSIERGEREGKLLLRRTPDPAHQPPSGFFAPPTIFGDVPADAHIACDEIFGPVLACMRVRSFNDAIRLAMQSEYALTGGLFSRNPAHIRRAKERFAVGNLYINRGITGALVGRQPFGGLRLSGVGQKAGGPDYLLQFVDARHITEYTLRRGFASELTSDSQTSG